MSSFGPALTTAAAKLGIAVELPQLELLESHYAAMVAANETMNLTRIVEPVEAAVQHYADSMAILPWARAAGIDEAAMLDIGTGAGFPAVPAAIMRPAWKVLAIDATRKKIEFVRSFCEHSGLQNLRAEHGHSDHWKMARKFDLVATRAVASLADCIRTARRFIKRGGHAVVYKTRQMPDEEWTQARRTCRELEMVLEPAFEYELELRGQVIDRVLIPVQWQEGGRKA